VGDGHGGVLRRRKEAIPVSRYGPLLHSDQGWRDRMQPYGTALARYGMKQSMSRKGNCYDNAAMESFFATLKAGYFCLSDFKNVEQLNAGLKSYIDYYNRHRIKSKPGVMSPVEYRLQAARRYSLTVQLLGAVQSPGGSLSTDMACRRNASPIIGRREVGTGNWLP
jgi:transposase InsO family protein